MDRPLQRGNFVENTGKTGSDYQYGYNHSSSSFGPVEQQTADPFCFDERKLYYGGYSVDNELPKPVLDIARPLGPASPDQNDPLSIKQPGKYVLPVPPPSMRPQSFNVTTPLKQNTTHRVHNELQKRHGSGTLPAPTDYHQQANLNAFCHHISSPTETSNDRLLMTEDMESPYTKQLTSPFFASVKPDLPKSTIKINPTGMPVLGGIDLISVRELPDRLRTIFPFQVFNRMQSKCFEVAYRSDDNLVVSAPTASGKTTVLEMAVCRLVLKADIVNTKIIYIGPTKALCEERHKDWSNRFQQLGIMCSLLTGETDGNQQEILKKSQLIITTPEKWDSITRKTQDQDKFMQLIRLLLIDEVHILNDERGATVEAVVSHMKSSGKSVRFIALSATIPNADDVAVWLGANNLNQAKPARLEVFGEEFRPSRLIKRVYPIPCKNGTDDFKLSHYCDSMLPSIITKHSAGKPILIFCATRKSTEATAKTLAEYWKKNEAPWPQPSHVLPLQSTMSKALAAAGIACHHAGLDSEERKVIEEAYLNGHLSIICCTSTLAVGVNLPCYLVIIKNTVSYTKEHGLKEYRDLDIMQMLGRAGRPQFGDHGVGVIITKASKVEKYNLLANGQELLESHLHKNLIEHLNAEIALGTIQSVGDAKIWLASTFLFVRLQRNRRHYQIHGISPDADIEDILERLCVLNIDTLRSNGIIETDQVKSSKFGELMARQYVHLKTMISFKNMPRGAKIPDILAILATAEEFQSVKFRMGEAALYKKLSEAHGLKYHVNNPDKDARKIVLIVQAELGGISYPSGAACEKNGVQYRQDVFSIFANIHRLIRCFVDTRCILGDGVSVKNGLEMSRSLAAKAWDNSPLILKQLTSVGPVTMRKFQQLGIKTIEDLKVTPVHKLDKCSTTSLFGTKLLDTLEKFPVLRISASILSQTHPNGSPIVHCQAEIGFINHRTPTTFGSRRVCIHFLIVRSDGVLIDLRHINDVGNRDKLFQRFSVKLEDHMQTINCYVSCDEIAGTLQEVVVRPDIPASRFPKPKSSIYVANFEVNETGFDGGDLMDQDLLDLELQDYIPIENFARATGDDRTNPVQESPMHQRKNLTQSATRNSIVALRVSSEIPKKLADGKFACNHTCKDKSACKHGNCCREGFDKLPQKRRPNTTSSKARNDHKSMISPCASNNKSSLLLNNITQPDTVGMGPKINKSVKSHCKMAGLERLHHNALGFTKRADLLSKITGNSTKVLHATTRTPALCESTEEFDDTWLDEVDKFDDLKSPEQDRNTKLNPDVVSDHAEDRRCKSYRRPVKRILDFLSDDELENIDTRIPERRSGSISGGNREQNFGYQRSAKRARTDQVPGHDEDIHTLQTVSPVPFVTKCNQRNASSDLALEPINVEGASPIEIDEEIAQASQEFAALRPFKNMDGIDVNFMAQFTDCCEFIE